MVGLLKGVAGAQNSLANAGSGGKQNPAIIFRANGAHTFEAPASGFYTFHLYGAGGNGGTSSGQGGGGGGAYARKAINLAEGDSVSLHVGGPGLSTGSAGEDTTLDFEGISVVAGGGTGAWVDPPGVGGVASGGDFNVNGSDTDGTAGGNSGVGIGGFADELFGDGSASASKPNLAKWPGGGGRQSSGLNTSGWPGTIIVEEGEIE